VTLFEENAEVLARLAARGVDLGAARDVDFSHLFEQEAGARHFAATALDLGYASQISEPELDRPEWDVTSTIALVPTCQNITESEENLANIASTLGGVADGWGFLSD
jgi:hypothetical protein